MPVITLNPENNNRALAAKIEYSLYSPLAQREDVEELCSIVEAHGFYSICINPVYASLVHKVLGDEARTRICVNIGFPYGANTIATKIFELADIARFGYVAEADVVLNLAYIKNHRWVKVGQEIAFISQMARDKQMKSVRFIIEAELLTEDEREAVCEIVHLTEATCLKTSTGVNGPGANTEIVKELRSLLDPKVKLIASGSIKSREEVLYLFSAGADMVATTSGLQIFKK